MHAEYCNVEQCCRRRRGRLHNHMSVLSIAGVTDWDQEVSICTHSLAVHFEYLVVRTDVTINKLVSDLINGVAFGERRARPRSCSVSTPVF